MCSAAKVLDVGGPERRIEIEGQLNAGTACRGDRDVRIAGKVVQDLETKLSASQDSRPAPTELGVPAKIGSSRRPDAVAEHDFLEQAHDDKGDTDAELGCQPGAYTCAQTGA